MFSDFSATIGSIEPSLAGISDGAPLRSLYYPKGETLSYNEDFKDPSNSNTGANLPRFTSVDGPMSSFSGQLPISSQNSSQYYERNVSAGEYDESHSEEHSSSGSEFNSPIQTYRTHSEAKPMMNESRFASHPGLDMSHYLFKPQYSKMSEIPAKPSLEFKFAPRSANENYFVQQAALADPHFQAHPNHYYPAQIEVSENEPPRSEYIPQQPPVPAPVPVHGYPDLTTMVNSSEQVVGPMVEVEFVDSKVCAICHKRISRDMIRHMRTHQKQKRFVCVFSDDACGHRSNQFNRRYDFTKHLLNKHFIYDIPEVVKTSALKDKLFHWGTCGCGQRFLAQNWLDHHVLTQDEESKCPLLKRSQGQWPE